MNSKYHNPKRFVIMQLAKIVDMKMDEVLQESITLVFDWANRMGLEGKRVSGLTFEKWEDLDIDDCAMNPKLKNLISCKVYEKKDE